MGKATLKAFAAGFAISLALPVSAAPSPQATIWHGGPIITMDGDKPASVEAVVERDGKIVFVGTEKRARKAAGRGAADHDLKGRTMLPGFFDAHSHFAMAMQVGTGVNLAEPSQPVTDIASLSALLRAEVAARRIAPGGWLVVWNYNEGQLAEKRHITRTELDAALPGYKVVLIHFTGHGLVTNSAVLDAAGLNDASTPPEGGLYLRDSQGHLNGVIFETAMMAVYKLMPQATQEERLAGLDVAQTFYASRGYTHAQEGGTQLPDLQFLLSKPAHDRLKIDLSILPFYTTIDWVLQRPELKFGSYDGHAKLQGIKFVLDGSPQARTAFFTRDYALGAPDGHRPWHGEASIAPADFLAMARRVHERGLRLFVHGNGDAAIDEAITVFDQLGIKAADNRRPVVIHSQFQRPDQLAAYARIGVAPAYFSNHTYYFADIHRRNFPAEVVDFISPFKAAAAAGLVTSNHSDYPVTGLDPFTQLWSSMARTSLSGVVSGPDQRLNAYEGLRALTAGPAWQAFDENRAGRLKPGLIADFVVLDRNPLTTPIDEIRSIKVIETVKEGRTIWHRPQ